MLAVDCANHNIIVTLVGIVSDVHYALMFTPKTARVYVIIWKSRTRTKVLTLKFLASHQSQGKFLRRMCFFDSKIRRTTQYPVSRNGQIPLLRGLGRCTS